MKPELNVERGYARNCPAPAKLNLFLHVTGQRADGYHLLQTAFQLIDRTDLLHFTRRSDNRIVRVNDIPGVPEAADLVVRAAKLLQSKTGTQQGVEITLDKQLPMGGGLGGGSSDAATTLMALNCLWECNLSRHELMACGLHLGADVPFFLFGQNAFAEGVGDLLSPLETPDCWYVVIEPGVSVPTQAIFSSKSLTRNSPSIKVADFHCYPQGEWRNDLEGVAVQLFPDVLFALKWLSHYGNARMTGSGSCVFCACDSEKAAENILHDIPSMVEAPGDNKLRYWNAWKAKSLNEHPLTHWLGSYQVSNQSAG